MKKTTPIQWSARILTLLFACFTVLFSFDVFEETRGSLYILAGLLIHNIPFFLVVLIVRLSWHREWIGGVFFPLLGILYIGWGWMRFPLSTYLLIAGPLFLMGILYWIGWTQRVKKGI